MASTSRDPRAAVSSIGEFALIGLIAERLGTADAPHVIIGPGDDAAVIAGGDRVVASTDVLVEGVHFRRDWSSGVDVGVKAAAANLADIAAMGATPTALLVGMCLPGEVPLGWVTDVVDGLRMECDRVGARVVGGDLSSAGAVVLAITALGLLAPGDAPLTRGGAVPGDVVAVSGEVGGSAAGLAVLRRGFTAPRAAVAAHRRPQPDYAAAARAVGRAHALMDVSDGLVADAGHLARASGVTLALTLADLPVPGVVHDVAAVLSLRWPDLALGGGEDHGFLGAFPADAVPAGFTVIGAVLPAGDHAVLVDGQPWAGAAGHEHFG